MAPSYLSPNLRNYMYCSRNLTPTSTHARAYTPMQLCQVWFHTGFVENNYLCFEKNVVDKACKVRKEMFLYSLSAVERRDVS